MNGAPVDLTERETEIFRLIAEGLSPTQIATQLYLTTATINGAMLRVRTKLGAGSTAHAVLIAERYHRHLLVGAIALHGTRGGRKAHLRYETPMCKQCETLSAEQREPTVMEPYRPTEPKTDRVRPNDSADCGTMPAVRRHIRQGMRVAWLTCGCREAYAAWHRDYRRDNGKTRQAS